jgi:uncharacterized protein involved in outer membrane biogenesis
MTTKAKAILSVKIIAAIAVILLILIYAAVYLVDISKYKSMITEKAKEATGRNIVIGDISLSPGLTPTIVLSDAKISNADWAQEPKNMIEVGELEINLKIIPLLKGNVVIDSIRLSNSKVFLEKNAEGKTNWEFTTKETEIKTKEEIADEAKKEKSSSFNMIGFFVNEVEIHDLTVAYKDKISSLDIDTKIDFLEVSADGIKDPLNIRTQGTYNKTPFDIKGRFLSIANLMYPDDYSHDDDDTPINTQIRIGDGYIDVAGNIKNIHDVSGLNLNITLQGQDLAKTLKPFASIGVEEIGAYNVKTSLIGDLKEKLAVTDFDMSIGDSKHFQLKADGSIKNVMNSSYRGIDGNISFKAKNLSRLINGTTAFPITELEGTLKDTPDHIIIPELKGKIGKSDIKTHIDFDMSGKLPKLIASIDSDYLNSYEIIKTMNGGKPKNYDYLKDKKAKKQSKSKDKSEDNNQKLFSDDPLPLDFTKQINMDIKASVKELITPQKLVAKNLTFTTKINNGVLSTNLNTPNFADGSVKLSTSLKPASGKNYKLNLDLKTKSINSGLIVSALQKKEGLIRKGATDITIKLNSTGKSSKAIASNADGQILVEVGDAKLPNNLIRTFGGDTLTNIANLINPNSDKDMLENKHTILTCAVANLKISDGVATADKGIAFETDVMNLVADGKIDFKDEMIDLNLAPYPQQGLKISVASIVGKLLKVKGPIASPSVSISKTGVAKSAVSIGAAMATGGMSLLGQKIIGTATEDKSPCETAKGN